METTQIQSEILVTGGTGFLGNAVCDLFDQHNISYTIATHRRVCMKDNRIFMDLASGEGIEDAVRGKKVILHLASDKTHPANDIKGTRALLDKLQYLEQDTHLIYISIVGVDKLRLPYFKEKWQVEKDIMQSGQLYSILRATQFHKYIEQILHQFLKWPAAILPKQVLIQPVNVAPVAAALFLMSQNPATCKTENLGGKQVLSLADAATIWLKHRNRKKLIFNFPLVGAAGKNLKAGALTCEDQPGTGITWGEWLNRA